MFENVDGQTDAGVIGILLAHLGAFGSGELTKYMYTTPTPHIMMISLPGLQLSVRQGPVYNQITV